MAFKFIRELGVKVGLKFDPAQADKIKKSVESIGKKMKELGSQVSEASAVLFEIAEMTGRHSRAVEENSEQLGIGVEKLQEWEYAAKVAANVSREELVGSFTQLSQTLFDARNNSAEAGQALVRLGITTQDLTDKNFTADKALLKITASLSKMPNSMYKTGLAASVGLQKMLPLINRGVGGFNDLAREAHETGFVMGHDMIKAGADFDRMLSKLWIRVKGLTFLLGTKLIMFFQMLQKTAKPLAAVMAGMVGFGVISGFSKLSKEISFLSGIFKVFNLNLLLASAALAAVILIIQDLTSDDSIIKEWFGKFKEAFPNLGGMAQDFVDVMVEGAKLIAEGWTGLFELFNEFTETFPQIIEYAKAFMGFAEKAAGWIRGGGIGESVFGAVNSVQEMFGGGEKGAMAKASAKAEGAANMANLNNQMNANINVNIPPGMSAKAATGVVSEGVQDGFMNMMRNARNMSTGGAAY